MKYTGPKVKLSRKLGIALTPKAVEYMKRKPFPPGDRGTRRRRGRESDYKRQVVEKQRLRSQYNIHERQMRNYFRRASAQSGNTIDTLIRFLESRLDAVVHRAGLAKTIYAARQNMSHGHFLVNGRPVNIPSYRVKEGDVIQVRERSKSLPMFREALPRAAPPPYLEVSKDDMRVRFLYFPLRDAVPVTCEMPLVIEFYTRNQ